MGVGLYKVEVNLNSMVEQRFMVVKIITLQKVNLIQPVSLK